MGSKKRQPSSLVSPATAWSRLEAAWKAAIDQSLEVAKTEKSIAVLVHRCRVSVKRLRGLLQLARPGLDLQQWRALDLSLRDLNRQLADVRTATVMADTRERLSEGDGSRFAHPALPHEVSLHSVPMERVMKELESKREALSKLEPRRSRSRFLEQGLRRTYKEGRRNFGRWCKEGNLHDAHECRKFAKYLMFQVELIRELDPKRLGRLQKRLRRLEGELGDLNDLVDFAKLQTGLKSAYLIVEKQRALSQQAQKTARGVFGRKPRKFVKRELGKVLAKSKAGKR